MNTLQTNGACDSADTACLCQQENRENVLNQIHAKCGSEQGDSKLNPHPEIPFVEILTRIKKKTVARSVAHHACNMQKARRAVMPSPSVVHMGMATPSASAAARMDTPEEQQECSCASANNSPALGSSSSNVLPSAHGAVVTPSASARVNAPSGTALASSSARKSTPTGVDAFTPFQGAGVQILPSLSVSGALVAVVAVLAAL